MKLGGGRMTKEEDIDHAVGLVLNKKIGDQKGTKAVTVLVPFFIFIAFQNFAGPLYCMGFMYTIALRRMRPRWS